MTDINSSMSSNINVTEETPIVSQEHDPSEENVAVSQMNKVCIRSTPRFLVTTEFFNKTQELGYILQKDLLACDAKWTLFVATALSYRCKLNLIPFPPRFLKDSTGYDIDGLVSVINDTPKLSVVLSNINQGNLQDMSKDVIELLHWLLVDQSETKLRPVDEEEISSIFQSITNGKISHNPTHVFELIVSKGFHSIDEFKKRNRNAEPRYGFYGQTLDTFYYIMNNGFPGSKKEPICISTDLLTSLRKSPCGAAWGASQCGSLIACLGVCQFVANEAEDKISKNRRDKSCLDIELNDPEKLCLRYILFYGCRGPRESDSHKKNWKDWTLRHKYVIPLAVYLIIWGIIGYARGEKGQSLTNMAKNKIPELLGLCKKFVGIE